MVPVIFLNYASFNSEFCQLSFITNVFVNMCICIFFTITSSKIWRISKYIYVTKIFL